MSPKKKTDSDKVGILKTIAKHWLKFGILILCGGIAWSGYNFKIGPFSCSKEQIKVNGANK